MGAARKRLNITQILLIDTLWCNPEKITPEYLTNIVSTGESMEIEAVALRDIQKSEALNFSLGPFYKNLKNLENFKESESSNGLASQQDHNCYNMWLKAGELNIW